MTGARRDGPAADAPVLLITGAGMAAATTLRTVPVLQKHFAVIVLHARRPTGRDASGGDNTIAQFAQEGVGLLDQAGALQAHVYGLSFGGLIAQELALRHPERVRSLVLAATSAGGALRVPPDPHAREFIERRADMPVEEGLWAAVPYSYALDTRRRQARRIGADIAHRLKDPVRPEDHRVQRAAVLRHDAVERLPSLSMPTLVVHGAQDRMAPPENGRLLADAIPGARYVVLADGAHMFPTDDPEADHRIADFFLEQAPATPPARNVPLGRNGSGPEARA